MMKSLILILSFIIISSSTQNLSTINFISNMGHSTLIKKKTENITYHINNSTKGFLPKKYFNLILNDLVKNKFECSSKKTIFNNKVYDTIHCLRTRFVNIHLIKLYFNFNNYSIYFTDMELFERKNMDYTFVFFSKNDIREIIIPGKLIKRKIKKDENKSIRQLTEDENNENKNDNDNENDNNKNEKKNNNNQNIKNSEKSGIGWLGICIIIVLSVIILYILYVWFRYYRRKKYQNPSFYYKITEEMFEDITPIE